MTGAQSVQEPVQRGDEDKRGGNGATLRERLLEASAVARGSTGPGCGCRGGACLRPEGSRQAAPLHATPSLDRYSGSTARAAEAVLDTLERELLVRAVRPLAPDAQLDFAVDAFDRGASVATVLSRLGGSARGFLRRFAEQVGLTPKRFGRVRRFRRVLESIEHGRPVAWVEIALDCGYFDQAHLINDFREFSGITPTAYRPRSYGDRLHVPLLDASAD